MQETINWIMKTKIEKQEDRRDTKPNKNPICINFVAKEVGLNLMKLEMQKI